ncbi:hypothetical protein ACFT2C_04500 [Promicromonospora sp. NPDC057138]|uniref:hypothetical protein n=1 Tax=Promicromonospora sp. NPDC057138 TaxID=3346031 RepID=UPI00364203D2
MHPTGARSRRALRDRESVPDVLGRHGPVETPRADRRAPLNHTNTIDNMPAPERVGVCDAAVIDSHGYEVACWEPLYVRREAAEVECPACGTMHLADDIWNKTLAASEDPLLTRSEIARALAGQVTIKQLEHWADPKRGGRLISDLAQSTGSDPTAVASVLDGVEHAVEEDLESDAILAPARDKRITELTPEQAREATQFLNHWLWNFDLDVVLLNQIFGEAYLFQVLGWAAMFAVLQVFLVAMLLPSDDEGDQDEEQGEL